MKYRKKPVEIEAFRFWVDEMPEWFVEKVKTREIVLRDSSSKYISEKICCLIVTNEGTMQGLVGDYIIKGVEGEIYPCKPSIFEATYERVENTDGKKKRKKGNRQRISVPE